MSSHGPWNFCPTATDLRPIGSRCCGPIGAELACGQPGGARGHASRARKLLGPSPPPQLVPELNTPARTRGAERSILQASDPAATYEARARRGRAVAELRDPPAYSGSGSRGHRDWPAPGTTVGSSSRPAVRRRWEIQLALARRAGLLGQGAHIDRVASASSRTPHLSSEPEPAPGGAVRTCMCAGAAGGLLSASR